VFADGKHICFILGEMQRWNSTLVIREFGAAPERRKQGIGKALLETAIARAKEEKLREVFCETQTTNVPANCLYQKLEFTITGLDLGLYSNQDLERGEVAIFLRKAIALP
jgi:ribosomal protein S18 acetylase RimI-like enzyme